MDEYQVINFDIQLIRNFFPIESGDHVVVVYSTSLTPTKTAEGYYSKFVKLDFKGGPTVINSDRKSVV